MRGNPVWRAKGLLFENCNCRLLCHCHVHFRQPSDGERCVGIWAVHIEDGAYGAVPLDGQNAFVFSDAPRFLLHGGWTQAIYLDERGSPAQREALETILTGRAGGGMAVMAALVGTRLPTRSVPIRFADGGRSKTMVCGDLGQTTVEAINGADKSGEVRLENAFNQIHGPSQVLAWGTTRFADRGLGLSTDGTHGLWSRFSWQGP